MKGLLDVLSSNHILEGKNKILMQTTGNIYINYPGFNITKNPI